MKKMEMYFVTTNGITYFGKLDNDTIVDAMRVESINISDNAVATYLKKKNLNQLLTVDLSSACQIDVVKITEDVALKLKHYKGLMKLAKKRTLATITNQVFDEVLSGKH